MADTGVVFGKPETRSVTIDSNLTDKEYFFVTMDTTDEHVVNLAAAATAVIFPLIEGGNGATTATRGTIVTGGQTKIKLGGSVNAGAKLTSDGAGKAVTASTGNNVGAIALAGGVDGDIIPVLVDQAIA